MIKKYASMSAFLLRRATDNLRGRRTKRIGIIGGKNGPTSIFFDIGRRPARDGSLIVTLNPRALAIAAATAAALLLLIITAGDFFYKRFGRRR